MKLFVLSIGGRERASSRLRVWDHVAWLRGCGHEVQADCVVPSGGALRGWRLALAIARRYPRWLRAALAADAVLVQEALALWPIAIARMLGWSGLLLFDFSDPVDRHGRGFRRIVRQAGFRALLGAADAIVVENARYRRVLKRHAHKIELFCGPVDVQRYAAARRASARCEAPASACGAGGTRAAAALQGAWAAAGARRLRLCWTGSPGTFAFLEPVLPAIDLVGRERPVELVLIGAPDGAGQGLRHVPVEAHRWEEEREFELVAGCDIGLFRLPEDQSGLYRGAGKLFIYLAAGLLPVASARGIAAQILRQCGTGIGVPADEDWAAALRLACNADLARARLTGTEYAARHLSYEAYRLHLHRLLQQQPVYPPAPLRRRTA